MGLLGQGCPEKEVGKTDSTSVHTGVGVGGTEVGGSGTAGTDVVSDEGVTRNDRTEVQNWVGVGGTVTEVGSMPTTWINQKLIFWSMTGQRRILPKCALQLLFQNTFQSNRNPGFNKEDCTKDAISYTNLKKQYK